jgi:hypothetical protein
MPEHEARGRAVYDHDNEEPRPPGRGRRQIADWGVGEEMFDHLPGRRFERRPHQEIPRGDAHDGRRTIVIETSDEELPVATLPPVQDEEFASREDALRAREAHDELWAGDEPFADQRAADAPEEHADDPADDDSWSVETEDRATEPEDRWAAAEAWAAGQSPVSDEEMSARTDGVVRGSQAGRRTVKIGGRPAEFHGTPARARRRPPRTVHERVGARPERIAAWAFALGILLILIAIATANA